MVHLWGNPARMDEIMEIARRHKLVVIEDCSHAHGAEYKGKKVGTIGDIGCFSLQGSKPMAAGEGGVFITNNPEYYDRALALGHHGRLFKDLVGKEYRKYGRAGFGLKYRAHPLAVAIANVQLKHLDETNRIRKENFDYLSSGLERIKGIEIPTTVPGATRHGHYEYRVIYHREQLNGIPRERFIEALQAEGVRVDAERYNLLHLNPLFQGTNIYGKGCPYDCPHVKRKVTYKKGDFPISEEIYSKLLALPSFAHSCQKLLQQYITAFEKVTANIDQLS